MLLKERETMKKTTIRMTLVALLLVVSGSTPMLAGGSGLPSFCDLGDAGRANDVVPTLFGGGQPPLCPPDQVCPKDVVPTLFDGGQPPLCPPDQVCPKKILPALLDGGGLPPLCFPGDVGCP